MTEEQIISEVNKILEKNGISLKINQKNLNNGLKETGINSLEMMEVVVTIEEKLDITLPDDKLLEIKTAKDLISLIKVTNDKKVDTK